MVFGQRNRHDNDVHADNFDNVVQMVIELVVMEMHVLVAAPVVVVH